MGTNLTGASTVNTVLEETAPLEIDSVQRGMILHLQRLSTEDGPGIRTTVFFKGCPLCCTWCHNPESISIKPQVQWLEMRCIGCNTCLKTCPDSCLTKTEAGIVIDRQHCQACGKCAEACPANAMELLGKEVTVDELVPELLKDKTYFDKSGGGITVSGGEPTMQPDFVAELLCRLKGKGTHIAVDTCGLCSTASLEKILPHTDIVLFDLKEADSERHRAFTGQDNQKILENLLHIRDYIKENLPGKVLWVRTPLIPGATADFSNITALGRFIAQNIGDIVSRWELCAFNNLCRDKYRRLGMNWHYATTPLLTKDELAGFEQCAKKSGVDPAIVFATGATKVEAQP